jgi:hypothetical protein
MHFLQLKSLVEVVNKRKRNREESTSMLNGDRYMLQKGSVVQDMVKLIKRVVPI